MPLFLALRAYSSLLQLSKAFALASGGLGQRVLPHSGVQEMAQKLARFCSAR
jgi:hypothetical protein